MATRFFFTISILLDHVNLLEICVFFYYKILIILTHGDVHTNPGPSPSSLFKFAHWNPNSLVAHNFSRIPILEAFMIKENLNLFAITESALKNSIPDRNIEIEGFSHIRNDLPPTDRCGGVLLYHRNDLPVKNRTDLQIPNSIVVEIHISRKKIFFIASYRKPSQTSPEFDQYIKNLDEILTKIKNENPYMTIMTGDFNAKHTEWYSEDNTDKFGDKIHELFAYHNLTQTVNKPTNITSRTKHCIDLVATDQPNLILNNDISPSLHTNCAHQINLVKLNLKCPPPPPYKRIVYHYARANVTGLKDSLSQFNWSEQLSLYDDPHKQVEFFEQTLLNITNNFIPHNEKLFKPRDPPWLTKACKSMYRKYHRKYSRYAKRGFKSDEKPAVDSLRELYTDMISKEKENYTKKLGEQVSNPKSSNKKYWTCLKKLLNNSKSSIIPPIIDNGIFVTDIKVKSHLFNTYFHSQCTVLNTSSILPEFVKKTTSSLQLIEFTQNQITDLIRKLQPNKSHGHDGISARILKLSDSAISLPLFIIFQNCVAKGIFPKKWKMANVSPIHKKNEKNIVSNYRPISLLPLCGKLFEKLIYDNLYSYIDDNNFISDKQSGYRRGDSTIKQLLSITNEIHKTFDQGKELRAVFLDISRAFDRVWHPGLIFKLRQIGIEGQAIQIIEDFLNNREQRVVIDGQVSDWAPIAAGVPQGSILGPLLFLVYINDITEVVTSDIQIFADDTFIHRTADSNSTNELNKDLESITEWAWQWKFQFNPSIDKQAVEMLFSLKKNKSVHTPLVFNGIPVKPVDETKHLGIILDSELSFVSHLKSKIAKANQGLGIMIQLRKWVSIKVLETVYKLFVRPHFDYGDVLYHQDSPTKNEIFEFSSKYRVLNEVEEVQYRAARIITGAWQGTSYEKLYKILGWESLNKRRTMRKLTILHETLLNKHPRHFYSIFKNNLYPENSRLANQSSLKNIPCKKSRYPKEFLPSTIKDWNLLCKSVKDSKTKPIFKQKILNMIRPKKSPFYGLFCFSQVRYLTMLRVGLSPLNYHKFSYNFNNVDEYCTVCECTENTEHYLLSCISYRLTRTTMYNAISPVLGVDVSTLPKSSLISILLYGRDDMTFAQNTIILKEVICFIKKTGRLDSM